MSSPPATPFKVTYSMIAGQTEELHRGYEAAIESVKAKLGEHHPMFINGKPVKSDRESTNVSPADTRIVLGYFQKGKSEHAREAIAAAKAAYPTWSRTPWRERVAILRRAADLISRRRFELAVLMSLEAGKNRIEALGDIEESADLIRYYSQQIEEHNGFEKPLGSVSPAEKTKSVLKSWGVWVVISPFNFPLALATGMCAGALVAGNTVVFKPATDTPYMGLKLYETLTEAGVPSGAFNYVTGSGGDVGDELVQNPDVAGLIFTGSKEVGSSIYRKFGESLPRPCIAEMGGKNPVIVTDKADLEKASEGVMRSAFGYGGQKCSACSRVYVHKKAKRDFTDLLVEKTRKIKIGHPLDRDAFLGPLINERAQKNFQAYAAEAGRDGKILSGGSILTEEPYRYGYYVTPTIVDGLPKDHRFFRDELFVPILVIAEVDSLKEAVELSNRSEFGLTAGIFSKDPDEVQYFFDNMEAGVLYSNRPGGATTGAWPGIQSFGGWKASGSSGKGALGPYYVQQFLREQSQTRVE